MEPLTHTLVSIALARAGLNRVTPRAIPIAITAGLLPDIDAVAVFAGPGAWLQQHYGATHSLVAGAVFSAAVAGAFWMLGRGHAKHPMRFAGALAASVVGVAAHLLLDVAGTAGVALLWPFSVKRYAWDLLAMVDVWALAVLLLGLLLPGLFRLVTEEIGAKPAARSAQRWAIAALVVLALFVGARGVAHGRAVVVLKSHVYRGATPLTVGAFPSPLSPFTWHGIVETENSLEQIEFSLRDAAAFNPDRSQQVFKPEPSPALEIARQTASARALLERARFPIATVQRSTDGWRVTISDLRDSASGVRRRSVYAEIEVSDDSKVLSEALLFGPADRR